MITAREAVARWVANGGTQRSLAAAIGVCESTVSYWRRGSNPHPDDARRLGQAVGATVQRLPTKRGAVSSAVLTAIAAEPGDWRPHDLAVDLGLTETEMKHQVDWLVRRGLVQRRRARGRPREVRPTPLASSVRGTSTSARVAAFVRAHPGASEVRIADRLGLTRDQVFHAVRYLTDLGAVQTRPIWTGLEPTAQGRRILTILPTDEAP